MKIPSDFIPESSSGDFGIENALAAYVRRRWPQNTVKAVMREFNLSEGKARGAVFAQATFSTFDEINRSPNGGPLLIAQLAALAAGETLITCIEKERAHAAAEYDRLDSGLRQMGRDLRALAGMGSAGPAEPDRPDHRRTRVQGR